MSFHKKINKKNDYQKRINLMKCFDTLEISMKYLNGILRHLSIYPVSEKTHKLYNNGLKR